MESEVINLNVKQAAAALGVSVPVLYRLMNERPDFPSMRLGRRRLINRRLLAEWAEAQIGGEGY